MRFVNIKKEDGSIEKFDSSKIRRGLDVCFQDAEYIDYQEHLDAVFNGVMQQIESFPGVFRPTSSQIGSIVEDTLIYLNHTKVAKAFILFRDKKNQLHHLADKMKVDVKELTENYLLQKDLSPASLSRP